MMNAIGNVINQIDSLVWGWWMIILLLGTHIFMTIRTGVIQRKIGTAIRLSVTKDPDAEGEVSQFGALTTALASTIGTGNIIGVGTAIALGGPGAVLWCWLTGVFGIATKYSESLIAVKYRVKTKDGRMQGGAMYALERGLNMRWLGLIFAFFGGFASFGIGCATQVNAIATVCNENLHIPPAVIGIAVAVLTALVIFGGIKSIATVCERLVPFMAFFYVIGCIIILGINFDFIIPAVKTICKLAFTPGAAAGGLVGRGIMMAMQYGIARGLFSNESGMGSAPIAAAAAQTRNPVRQALVSSTGTFWDTVVVCLMTGLVLVTSIMKNPSIDMGNITDGGVLTTLAFQQIPGSGPRDPGGRYHFLRILYRPWMGILRGTVCRVFFRQKRPYSISCSVHCGSRHCSCYFSESGMDRSRYPECPDGHSEPDRSITSFQCDHKRDPKIYQ